MEEQHSLWDPLIEWERPKYFTPIIPEEPSNINPNLFHYHSSRTMDPP